MCVQELANRKYRSEIDSTNPLSKQIVDVDCVHQSGKFVMMSLPKNLPSLFTIRFTAPADFTQGDVVVIRDKELPAMTPGMVNASTELYKAGAVMHCDIDMDREIAFFWQNGNGTVGGVLPNLSYDEQFAGYHDFDGSKVYRKAVMIDSVPSGASNQHYPIDIVNPKRIVRFEAYVDNGYGLYAGSHAAGTASYICTAVFPTSIEITTNNNTDWATRKLWVIFDYTCTDR